MRISGELVESESLSESECKLILKSLHLIKVKKSPMFMGFFFLVSDNIVLIECKEEFSKDLNM